MGVITTSLTKIVLIQYKYVIILVYISVNLY